MTARPSNRPVHRHPRILEHPRLPSRRQLMRPRMLRHEDPREAARLPALDHAIEHGLPLLVVLKADHPAENSAIRLERKNCPAQNRVEEVVGFGVVVLEHNITRNGCVAFTELDVQAVFPVGVAECFCAAGEQQLARYEEVVRDRVRREVCEVAVGDGAQPIVSLGEAAPADKKADEANDPEAIADKALAFAEESRAKGKPISIPAAVRAVIANAG